MSALLFAALWMGHGADTTPTTGLSHQGPQGTSLKGLRMIADIITRNNVHIGGTGSQPMMFAHGFGCEQSMWRLVSPAFDTAYQTILFDYVGSGYSDLSAYNPARYATLQGYVQDVLDICTALDLRNLLFVGHSISGMIGALAAIQAPERFARVILIGSSARYLNDPPEYIGGFEREDIDGLLTLIEKNSLGWASYLSTMVTQNTHQPALTSEIEASFRSLQPRIAQQFAATTFLIDHRADLPQVAVPCLVLQTADDVIVPRVAAEYLAQHLPNSRFSLIDVAGHYPHLSHPAHIIRELQAYVAGTASV